HVSLFVKAHLATRKGTIHRHRAGIHPHLWLKMKGRDIEALMLHGIDHAAYKALALLRGFCTNNSRYSWHRDAKVATTVRLRVKSAELHYWANGEGKDS